MDKWFSKTIEQKSKAQFQSDRTSQFKKLLRDNGLNTERAVWLGPTPQEKALATQLWAHVDAKYEQNKAALIQALTALSPEDRATYFSEIGLSEQNPADWLKPS